MVVTLATKGESGGWLWAEREFGYVAGEQCQGREQTLGKPPLSQKPRQLGSGYPSRPLSMAARLRALGLVTWRQSHLQLAPTAWPAEAARSFAPIERNNSPHRVSGRCQANVAQRQRIMLQENGI